ncbi:MAG: extracellular solute-binding protein [Bacteroidetes bacterium]|nr:MAG: extracellular solute-binding protein [Bacteroidota bacterium]
MKTPLRSFLLMTGILAAVVAMYSVMTDFGTRSLAAAGDQVQRVYFADHLSPAHRAVIAAFNEKHAGRIEVVAVDLPFSKFSTNERKELLARSLRSKSDRLDVFSVDYIWTPRFAKWCEDLAPYFPERSRADIIPPALQACIIDGQLAAMPLYIDIGILYYRRDIIARLPDAAEVERRLRSSISWDEMFRLRDRLGYAGRPYYLFQANDYEGLICNYFEAIRGIDSNAFRDNRVDLRSPAARAALRHLVGLVRERRVSPPSVVDFDENKSYEYMLRNDAVFVRGWPNFVENFRKFYPDTSKFSAIGRAALPHFPGGRSTSVYGGWNLMVSKFSTKKAAAVEFVRYLQTEEAQRTMFELGGYIPVNGAVYRDSLFLARHPDLTYYRTLVGSGFHRPFIVDYTRISDIVSYYVHRALRGEIGPDEALDRASDMIESQALLIR